MKVVRGICWALGTMVVLALFLRTCGFQAGTPTIRSSGNIERDARRVFDQCDLFDGFIGFWIEGPSAVRVNFGDGGHTDVPCFGDGPDGGLGDISRGPSTATNGHSPNGYVGAEPKRTVPPRR